MYSIYADDICIHDDVFLDNNMKAISPKLTLEDNAAGSLEITLTTKNPGYETIKRLTTDISVRKDGKEIWAGRVLSESVDFYNNRVLYCEGELAFFNDTTQPPNEYKGLTIRGYLEKLVAIHNSKVETNRRIELGAVGVTDDSYPTRYTNNEKTMELLNKLVEQYGGHLRVRKNDSGVRILEYLSGDNLQTNTNSQTIQFGRNLIDFTRSWDLTEFATVILPLGKQLSDDERSGGNYIDELDAYLTVEKAKNGNGSRYVQSEEAVKAYGWIEKSVTWDDVEDPDTLLEKAKAYLSDLQFDNLVLELKALDLHYLNADAEAVKLLDYIQVISKPHGLDRKFLVTKLEIPLDSPEQTEFTLGDTVKTSLTSINNKINNEIVQKIEKLPTAHVLLTEAKNNAAAIMDMATNGYITITKGENGTETLYISDTQKLFKDDGTFNATRYWKWGLNGLAYYDAQNSKYNDVDNLKLALTMDGSIVADFITAGTMNADLIRTGEIAGPNRMNYWNLNTGEFHLTTGTVVGDSTIATQKDVEDSNSEIDARLIKTVKSVDVEYAINQNAATAPTSGWKTTVTGIESDTHWKKGWCLWSRTKTVYEDGTPEYSKAYLITNGDGIGVSKVTELYCLTNSSTSCASPVEDTKKPGTYTNGWSTEQPAYDPENSAAKFYWTCTRIDWADGTPDYTDPVLANSIVYLDERLVVTVVDADVEYCSIDPSVTAGDLYNAKTKEWASSVTKETATYIVKWKTDGNWEYGNNLWSRTKMMLEGGTPSYTEPYLVADGEGGGIKNVTELYYLGEYDKYDKTDEKSEFPDPNSPIRTAEKINAAGLKKYATRLKSYRDQWYKTQPEYKSSKPEKKYYWTCSMIEWTDGSVTYTEPVLLQMFVDLSKRYESLVTGTDVEYACNEDNTTPPAENSTVWKTTMAEAGWKKGKCLWSRTKSVHEDKSVSYTTPYLITDKNGKGITSVTEQYYLSESDTTQTGGSWSDTQPAWVSGRYYWTRSEIQWVDGRTTHTTPVLASALTSGNQSSDDLDKRLIVTVVDADVEYLMIPSKCDPNNSKKHTDSVTGKTYAEWPAGTKWVTTMTTWQQGMCLWSRTKMNLEGGGTPQYTEPYLIADENGGGIKEVTELYLLHNSKTMSKTTATSVHPNATQKSTIDADDKAYAERLAAIRAKWSKTQPTYDPTNPAYKYYWTCSKIVWTDGTTDYTDPVILQAFVDIDNRVAKVVKSTDVLYAINKNAEKAPTSGWSTTARWKQGYCLWSKTKMILEDGTPDYTTPVLINKGEGIIKYVTELYCLCDRKSSMPIYDSPNPNAAKRKTESDEDYAEKLRTIREEVWFEKQPVWESGKYYWTCSRITFADGTVTYTDPVLASALTSGNQSSDDLDERLVVTVVDADVEYILLPSKCHPDYPSGGKVGDTEYAAWPAGTKWVTTMTTWEQGKCLWSRTKMKLEGGGTPQYTDAYLVADENGGGIKEVTELYCLCEYDKMNDTSEFPDPNSPRRTSKGETLLKYSARLKSYRDQWYKTQPTYNPKEPEKKYYWTCSYIVWTDGTPTYTVPVLLQAFVDLDKRYESLVTGTDVEYACNEDNTTPPAENSTAWKTTMEEAGWEKGKCLWSRTKSVHEDKSVSYTTPYLITDKNGKGISKVTELYILYPKSDSCLKPETYFANQSTYDKYYGYGWSETQPEWKKGRYYWTCSKIEWVDGTTDYTDPVLATALTSGNQKADDAEAKVTELDFSLDQTGVYNRLTNNGRVSGIFLENVTAKDASNQFIYLPTNATVVYARATAVERETNPLAKPVNGTKSTSIPNVNYTGWHKTYNATFDRYISYTTDSGKTWSNIISMNQLYINADYIATGILRSRATKTIKNGNTIVDTGPNVMFNLDNGELTMRSGSIKLGEYTDGHYQFEVTDDGTFYVGSSGIFAGELNAAKGSFGGSIVGGSITIPPTGQVKFSVTEEGKVTASDIEVKGGEITIGTTTISSGGKLTATNAELTGVVKASDFQLSDGTSYRSIISSTDGYLDGTYVKNINANNITAGKISAAYIDATDLVAQKVEAGISISSPNISGGTINIGDGAFVVKSNGDVTLKGNITWGGSNSPGANSTTKVLYARTKLDTPVDAYDDYPLSSALRWHQTYNKTSDKYASYNHANGAAGLWMNPVEIGNITDDVTIDYDQIVLELLKKEKGDGIFAYDVSGTKRIGINAAAINTGILSAVDGIELGNGNFKVEKNGDVTLKGNITWGAGSSPTEVVYARKTAVESKTNTFAKPANNTLYSSFPNTSTTGWHKTFNSTYDYYASYTYDGGATWTAIVKIRGEDGEKGEDGDDIELTYANIVAQLLEDETADGIYAYVPDPKKPNEKRIGINASAIKTGILSSIEIKAGTDAYKNPVFHVMPNGDVTMNGSLTIGGNITWSAGNSPTKVVYARTSLPKPANNTTYSSFDAIDASAWHTTFDKTNDYYASYTYDGGATWTDAIKIRGEDGQPGEPGAPGDNVDVILNRAKIVKALLDQKAAENAGDGIYALTIKDADADGGERQCIGINASAINVGILSAIEIDNGKFKVDKEGNVTLNGTITFNSGASKISAKKQISDLADVATSGDYGDLINKPKVPTLPTYIEETKITSTTIESPTIIGGKIYATENGSYMEISSDAITYCKKSANVYAPNWSIDTNNPNVEFKSTLYNIAISSISYIKLSSGSGLTISSGTMYGYSLPTTTTSTPTGRIFFLLS